MKVRIGVNRSIIVKGRRRIEHGPSLVIEVPDDQWDDDFNKVHEAVRAAVREHRPGYQVTGYAAIDRSKSKKVLHTKDGLLYLDGRCLSVMEADQMAKDHGFSYAEELVKHLERGGADGGSKEADPGGSHSEA